MRRFFLALSALLVAAPAVAQHHDHGAANTAQQAGSLPAGWHARVDRDRPLDQIRFMEHDGGFHAVMGPAAVFYTPAWTHAGEYRVSARFRQNQAPKHPEAYGIVIGGRHLDGAEQAYSYFLVRGTGEYFIATRKGAERTKVVDWTAHPAIAKQDAATGVQTNVLGAEVRGDEVVFSVNGTEVARRPRGEVLTDGLFGFRVNHNLDVQIDQVRR